MTAYTIGWGIVGCGWISSEFVKDIGLIRQDVDDVYHAIAAVGSRSIAKAEEFIAQNCPRGANAQQLGLSKIEPQACGTYQDVYNHSSVDVVYIGTTNPSHYPDAKAALKAGKHCLIEKPACLNRAQWADLVLLATEKNLFLMEAMWSRFLPLTDVLLDKLHREKVIGDLKSVHSDFSMAFYDVLPDTHRCIALEQAGGPLYDLGPYILHAPMLFLYNHPDNGRKPPSAVSGHILKARTGVDLTSTVALSFPNLNAVATGTCSFAYNSYSSAKVTIIGSKGQIVVHDGPNNWSDMTVHQVEGLSSDGQPIWGEPTTVVKKFPGFGLMFEADAVARCIRDGKLASSRMPHDETDIVLGIFEKVHKDGGYILPSGMGDTDA